MLRDLKICYDNNKGALAFDKSVTLYHAAAILRSNINEAVGIPFQPLNHRNNSEKRSEAIVSDGICNVFYLTICPKFPQGAILVNKVDLRRSNPSLHRHVLSLGQYIIYMGKGGKVRTPKHTGMSITCHKMTQSKTLIIMLNRNGQGISYDEVQGIDTAWADMQINANRVVIPSNISQGLFTHAAADNWNGATGAITGQHFDIVNMVLYQAKQADLEGEFNCEKIIFSRERKRSLTARNILTSQILNCPHMTGKTPGPMHLKDRLDCGWFSKFSEEHADMKSLDNA